MTKAILIILTLAGFAAGAEFEVADRLSVDGSSIFKSTALFSGSVGIGTTIPTGLLQVGGGNLTVLSNGDIGIGTTNPGYIFHVNSTQSGNNTIATFESGINSGGEYNEIRFSAAGNTSPAAMRYLLGTSPNSSELSFHISTNATGMVEVMRLDKNGNVGIGTAASADKLEVFGTFSVTADVAFADGTGGTITHIGGYTIHTFTSGGAFNPGANVTSVDALVVAGGGGGGSSGGGGGGAGGFRTVSGFAVANQAYSITVGAGGAANSNGSDSIFSSITSIGGGHGGTSSPGSGGSGGGGGGWTSGSNYATGIAGQGNNGGYGDDIGGGTNSGGGGGGAGAAGGHGGNATGGGGGAGTVSSISGSPVTYAGGGGGVSYNTTGGAGGSGGGGSGGSNNGNGTAGTANTGGGGGGSGGGGTGGSGGSGIVIIRYLTPTDIPPHTKRFFIDNSSGNVGIGTTSPGAKLEVSGNAMIGGGSANKAVCWKSDGKTLGYCSTTPTDGSCTCN